jgi:hypothetical protein
VKLTKDQRIKIMQKAQDLLINALVNLEGESKCLCSKCDEYIRKTLKDFDKYGFKLYGDDE